jgi:CRISPR-associated protein (TIGR03984 family)
MSETKLLIYKAQDLSLADAITAFVKAFDEREKHYALLYAPQRCHLALIDATGKATEADKNGYLQGVSLQGVFEGRIFNSQAELRWFNVPDGVSDVAIVTETDLTFTETVAKKFKRQEIEPIIGTIKQSYLLWGEGVNKPPIAKNGWSKMATARIGAYYVPIAGVEHKDRVQLAAIEYLKKYTYGNVGVCEERLTGLLPAGEETATQATENANQKQAEEVKANE